MSRRLLAVLTAGALLALPAASRAQSASFLVSGGLSVPMSDLNDLSNSGYNVNIGLAFGAPLIPIGARIEGGFSSFDAKGGGGASTRIASATANAILNLGAMGVSPYLIGGLGIYNRHFSSDAFAASDDRTTAGVNIGGGIHFPLGGISTFLEARYHVMLGNSTEATNLQFIPISFGVQF
jgi:hypothetical protein